MPVDNASAVGTVFDIKQLAVYDGPRHPHDGVFEGLPAALYVVPQPGGAFLQTAANGIDEQLPALRCLYQGLPEWRENLHGLRPVHPRLPTGAAQALPENAIRRRSWPGSFCATRTILPQCPAA